MKDLDQCHENQKKNTQKKVKTTTKPHTGFLTVVMLCYIWSYWGKIYITGWSVPQLFLFTVL